MQAAGYFISPAAEFAAGMKNCENYLYGRKSCFFLDIDRNSTAVIHYRDRIILINLHFDLITIAGQGLIYRIVHDLIHKVVEAPHRSTSNIHTGTFTDRLQPFQYLYLICTIF